MINYALEAQKFLPYYKLFTADNTLVLAPPKDGEAQPDLTHISHFVFAPSWIDYSKTFRIWFLHEDHNAWHWKDHHKNDSNGECCTDKQENLNLSETPDKQEGLDKSEFEQLFVDGKFIGMVARKLDVDPSVAQTLNQIPEYSSEDYLEFLEELRKEGPDRFKDNKVAIAIFDMSITWRKSYVAQVLAHKRGEIAKPDQTKYVKEFIKNMAEILRAEGIKPKFRTDFAASE